MIPGSQGLPDSFEHTFDETVPAEMSKGSCLLYTGSSTPSAAGPAR